MASDRVEEGDNGHAPAAAAAPQADARERETDSQLSDSLPKAHQDAVYRRQLATAMALATTGGQDQLPYDDEAPLPEEATPEDDGWDFKWDYGVGNYFYYNRFTGVSQWENPRVPQATAAEYDSYDRYVSIPATTASANTGAPGTSPPPKRKYGGYNPSIHGNWDPNADYAREAEEEEEEREAAVAGLPVANIGEYNTDAHFNRFTGRFQQPGMNPEYHNDENKSKRQMSAYFDVDAAANSHDGRSLKAERRGKHLSKKELKEFKNKRRDKKEEKRRAWLKD